MPCTRTLAICKVSMSKSAHFFLVSSFSCKTASAATAVHPLILRFLITSIRLFYAPRRMRTTTTKDQSALQSTSPYTRYGGYLHDVAWSASGGKLRKIIIIIKRFYDIYYASTGKGNRYSSRFVIKERRRIPSSPSPTNHLQPRYVRSSSSANSLTDSNYNEFAAKACSYHFSLYSHYQVLGAGA